MTKILSCAAVLGLLVASSSSVLAGGRGGSMGVSSISPGNEFRTGTNTAVSVGGPGASGYAPGRRYLEDRNESPTAREIDRDPAATGPGASVYAPGFLK
jgi:hypothetical protein